MTMLYGSMESSFGSSLATSVLIFSIHSTC
jgi:hypothetical protein